MREHVVAELMEPEVAVLAPDDGLDLVDDLMSLGDIRHLPVVEGEVLVGIVSHRDLLAASLPPAESPPAQRRQFLRTVSVREIMSTDLETIAPTTTLHDAAGALLRRRIGALPVLLGERLVGILSESDLVRHAYLGDGEKDEDVQSTLTGRLVELRRLGDELRVQAHLGQAEAKDVWLDLEKRLESLGADLRHAQIPGDGVLGSLISGVENLLKDLRRPVPGDKD